MANTMTGRIKVIMPTETITSKSDSTKTFLKRTIVLDCTRYDQYTGERGYDNFPSFEFSGERCSDLDKFKVGQVVTLSFDLQGNKFVDSTGKERYFTSIRGYKIELIKDIEQPLVINPNQSIQQNSFENKVAQVQQQFNAQVLQQPQTGMSANVSDPLPF